MALPIMHLKHDNIRQAVREGAQAEARYLRALDVVEDIRTERPRPKLRVVPPRKRAVRVATVVFAALFLTLLCITVLQTRLSQRQIGVERINRQIEIARERFDALRKENARLSSPDVIESRARELGMVLGTPQKAVGIDPDALVEASAAFGQWGTADDTTQTTDPLAEHKRIKQVSSAGAG